MLDWHFLLSSFILSNLILCGAKNPCDLCLRQIVINPKITNFLCIFHHYKTPPLVLYHKYITTP